MKEIEAIAFDIDGTLYSDMSLYIRILPYFLKRLPFFLAYNRARKILHRTAPLADFYEYQARLLAEELKISSQDEKKMIQEKRMSKRRKREILANRNIKARKITKTDKGK
mgnify:CR=1 FL=1